jgi:hypothetical protein
MHYMQGSARGSHSHFVHCTLYAGECTGVTFTADETAVISVGSNGTMHQWSLRHVGGDPMGVYTAEEQQSKVMRACHAMHNAPRHVPCTMHHAPCTMHHAPCHDDCAHTIPMQVHLRNAPSTGIDNILGHYFLSSSGANHALMYKVRLRVYSYCMVRIVYCL